MHERVAAMESSLIELTSELQFSQSTTLAVQGELKSFNVCVETVKNKAKTASGTNRQQLLEHKEIYAGHEKIIVLQKETLHSQQHAIQLLVTRVASLEEALGNTTAEGRKTKERLIVLEKRTEEGLKKTSEHVEAGLEELGDRCCAMLGKSARQRIKVMSAERQRSDLIVKRLSNLSISGQQTFEEQNRNMWEHILHGDGERAQMSRQYTKLTQRVEDTDRELNVVTSQVNQASKQAWEAARLANDGKNNVTAINRELAQMTGTVEQCRESTLIAIGNLRKFAMKGVYP